MRALRSAGMDSWAWALRRYHVPVPPDALVLEVGSGGNPYPRANVLLDAYEHTRERHWAPLITDRPTVLGFVENLPFKDKSFDFVIAAHVLEHSAQPEKFLAELQRVARAGYIETPDAYMERTNPYRDHRLEVTVRNGDLVIRKKQAWVADEELAELYEHAAKWPIGLETIPKRPFSFHVRFYWRDSIPFRVVNPQVDAGWPASASHGAAASGDRGLRARARGALRGLLSQTQRNRALDPTPLLRCTNCGSGEMARSASSHIECRHCQHRYSVRGALIETKNS
jgi:SAM-dependent methyltransferase